MHVEDDERGERPSWHTFMQQLHNKCVIEAKWSKKRRKKYK